jgi:hypothetical protein
MATAGQSTLMAQGLSIILERMLKRKIDFFFFCPLCRLSDGPPVTGDKYSTHLGLVPNLKPIVSTLLIFPPNKREACYSVHGWKLVPSHKTGFAGTVSRVST